MLVNKFRWLWRHCAGARGGALTAAAAMRARAPESALNRAFTFGGHNVTVKLRVWLRPSPALQISAALLLELVWASYLMQLVDTPQTPLLRPCHSSAPSETKNKHQVGHNEFDNVHNDLNTY